MFIFGRSEDRPVEVNKRREDESSITFSTRKVTAAVRSSLPQESGEDDKEEETKTSVRSDHVRFADE